MTKSEQIPADISAEKRPPVLRFKAHLNTCRSIVSLIAYGDNKINPKYWDFLIVSHGNKI